MVEAAVGSEAPAAHCASPDIFSIALIEVRRLLRLRKTGRIVASAVMAQVIAGVSARQDKAVWPYCMQQCLW